MRRRFLQHMSVTAALAWVASRRLSAQEVKPYRIYAVTWRGKTQVEKGFEDYLARQGIAVELIWRDAAQQAQRLPGFVNEIRSLRPDLVYTWGTPPTLGIVGGHAAAASGQFVTDIPVVFALVAAPVAAGLVPSLSAQRRDLTGVSHVAPVEAQLQAIRAYRPFTRLGVLYNAAERNSIATAEALRRLAGTQGFELIERTFDRQADGSALSSGIAEKVTALKQAGAQWLYLGPDSYLFSQMPRVAEAAMAQRLPTFSATEAALDLPAPILTGLVSSYYTVGQFAGYKAEQILVNKQPARNIPIETLSRFLFVVRMDVAKQLDLLPPVALFNLASMR
jgi:putative tryptophan/tyrosine transport system substrate-binding protein